MLPMTNPFKNRSLLPKSTIFLLAASLLSACDKQTVYHAYQSLSNEGWKRTDTICFPVEVPDSQTYYKLSIEVRNRNNYPYQNLNLTVGSTAPDGSSSPADTLHFTLATPEGVWQGNGWGGLYQSRFPAGSIRIGKPGTYLLKIVYAFPDEKLPGINDIGIKLER